MLVVRREWLRRLFYWWLRCWMSSVLVTFVVHLVLAVKEDADAGTKQAEMSCQELLMGQYLCAGPDIDPDTQQAKYCDKDTLKAPVWCTPAPGIDCDGLFSNGTFKSHVACKWTNGRSFETSLLLSIFLGMFGVDRFYLGYPAIGLVKFSTLGLMFIGQLIDVLLIATQVLQPADGSAYVVDYFGTATLRVLKNNETFLKTSR